MRRVAFAIATLVALGAGALGVVLVPAHRAIRAEQPPLPTLDALLATPPGEELPVGLRWIDTATQPMPRAQVLDPDRDPVPGDPYVMSHPAFALEWADGRRLLVDVGMTPDQARRFGAPLEWIAGASPIVPHGAAADAPGLPRERVGAVVFTHLHEDHVGGVVALCARAPAPVRVPLNAAQAARGNHTTRGALALVRAAPCVREERLADGPLAAVPGFPGVRVVPVAGHTPGSQLVVAHLAGAKGVRPVVFTGDVANAVAGIRYDVPKPRLYRLLVVPENDTRLGEVRRLLRMAERAGAALLVAHDRRHLEQLGIGGLD